MSTGGSLLPPGHLCNMSHRRYCFTKNNYTDDDEQLLFEFGERESVVYLVYGRELAPTTGTKHLQGFFILSSPQRITWLNTNLFQCHYEVTRGTSQQAADYCKKENDFEEYGTFPASAGKRTDIETIIEWIDEFGRDNGRPPTDREIAMAQPRAFLVYRNIGQLARMRCPAPTIRVGEPNDWQSELSERLSGDADDRTVDFFVDVTGGKGKTWFQQWYFSNNKDKTQLLGVGKRDDMAFAIDASKSVFFVNIPRGGMEYLQYTILEQLKDRMVFSNKYETVMKILTTVPHVVVFSNEEPDMNKMSLDRFNIKYMH